MKNIYQVGDIVYLKTDPEQRERIVTGVLFRPVGVSYDLAFGSQSSWHFEIEIASEKNLLKTFE